jgi:hypothetical protein
MMCVYEAINTTGVVGEDVYLLYKQKKEHKNMRAMHITKIYFISVFYVAKSQEKMVERIVLA